MEKQKLRSEIDDKYKWDLSSIYKSDDEFLKELESIKEEIKEVDKYSKTIMSSAENLYNALKLTDNLEMKLEKLYSYAHLHNDEDTSNNKYQKYYGLVINLDSEYSKITSFIIPELMKYDYSKIEEFYKDYPKLKEEYEFVLSDLFRSKKYKLDENVEKALSHLTKAFDNSEDIYSLLTNSDFTYDNIKLEDGKEIELTDSNYSIYISSNNRNIRKSAFDSMYKTYKKYTNTISKCLSNNVEANVCLSKLRGYKSTLSSALFDDNISVDVYNNLITTVSNNLNPLFDYYNYKKKLLNLDELHIYDIFTPVIDEKDKTYTFEEAKKLVIDSLKVLGDDYIKVLESAFNERWIDVYNNKGKRGGAYSSGSYLTKPFLLLNYEGRLNDVSTLAHELGHSMHTYYSCKNNPYQYHGYKIFVAEVASQVNELLLANYILNNSNDKEEKISVLNNLLELYKASLFRQTMFAQFEKEIYEAVENGEILTSDYLCNKYYNINKEYFGDSVVLDEEIKYEWERIPHFYYFFYVYKYATSICAATYIANEILKGNDEIKEKYLKFLTLGGSMYPLDELKTIGIDMTDKKVIEDTIKYFEDILNQFKILSE
ncbi:MAG: oligoendopeptidase F [Bacilli bacterium]|nr:oligoendopeptidase F [Bacilli bacterium]